MCARILFLAGAACCGLAFAQVLLKFEIADVHVSAHTTAPSVQPFDATAYAPNRMKGDVVHNGIYIVRAATMVDLIRTAWGVHADAVMGGPSWLEADRFDVIARVPAGTTAEAARLMLRGLLTERFQLVTHNDEKPLPAWVLSAGKRPQLREVRKANADGKPGCQSQPQPGPRPAYAIYSCRNMTMGAFAEALRGMGAAYLGTAPLVDRTGLKGAWDFDIKWSMRPSAPSAGTENISLFDALDGQLGLKLEMQEVPMPVIAVDRVSQRPTPNLPGVAESFPQAPAEFEVADVKPSLANAPEGGGVLPGGRIEMRGNTMKDFIKFAWNIDDTDDDSLIGGPKWLDDDRFDIVAKAFTGQSPTGESIDVDALRPMMKALLLDRFKLKVHNQEQPIAVYALGMSKRGPKLAKADPASRSGCGTGAVMTGAVSRIVVCRNTTMAQFAEALRGLSGGYVDHPVVDMTGLAGAWDFSLSFTPRRAFRNSEAAAGSASDPNGAMSLFEALDKQLGLKLEAQKHSMPVFVVDHVEQRPTEN